MRAVFRMILVWAVSRFGIALSETLPIQNGLDTPVGIAGFHEQLVTDGLGVLFPGEEQAHVPGGIVTFGGGEDPWPQLFRMGLVPVETDGTLSYPFTVELDDETGEALFRNANGALFYSIEPAYAAATEWFRMRLGVPAFGPVPAYRELSHLVSEWILVHEDDVESLQVQGRKVQSQNVQSRGVAELQSCRVARLQSREEEGLAFTEFEITDAEPPEYVFSVAWNGDVVATNDVLDLYGAPALTTNEWSLLESIAATNESPFELTLSEMNFPWYIPPVECPRDGCSCPACVPVVVTNYAGSAFDPSATNLTMMIVTNTTCNCPSGAPMGFFRLFRRADSDADGLLDAEEVLFYGTDPLASDSDGDGLDDAEEIDLGTDPFLVDTDGDGITDIDEILLGFDPCDAIDGLSDGDEDGLTYAEERNVYGTDPLNWDTDFDGLSDGDEIDFGTDPFSSDTDLDGLSDGNEIEAGCNPLRSDTDADGIPDGWEYFRGGFSPNDPTDGAADWDEDGLCNALEIASLGTDWHLFDTDGDGLSDGEETTNTFTHPLRSDSDFDGLRDREEILRSLNPHNSDQDSDGFPDGWEVLYGFDPTSPQSPDPRADPDGDHLDNRREAELGTNPFATDTDGDGLDDSAETGWFVLEPVPFADTSAGTNLLSGFSNLDDDAIEVPLPVSIPWPYDDCSRMVVSLNGLLEFHPAGQNPPDFGAFSNVELRQADNLLAGGCLYVAPFWDDLAANVNGLDSSLRFAAVETNGVHRYVLDFEKFGFVGGSTNDFVSFQVSWGESARPTVSVRYSECSGLGTGGGATIGYKDSFNVVEYSHCDGQAITPGLGIVFHPGSGSDPCRADTDMDGVGDEDEFAFATNPRQEDISEDDLDGNEPSGYETVPVRVVFGDHSASHSEKYRIAVVPVSGDSRPACHRENHAFGEPDELTVRLRPGAVYQASLEHLASSLEEPDFDYTLSIETDSSVKGHAVLRLDPEGICGKHEDSGSRAFYAEGKTIRFVVLHADLVHDVDRNGVIGEDDRTDSPLRMWINDDSDDGSVSEGLSNLPLGHEHERTQEQSDKGGNRSNPHIDGLCDLEDLFPIWLDISEPIAWLAQEYGSEKISVHLFQADCALSFCETSFTTNTAGAFLSNPPAGIETRDMLHIPSQTGGDDDAKISSDLIAALANDPAKGILLLEGFKEGIHPLGVEIRLNKNPVCRVGHPIVVSDIHRFYRWINLRDSAGGSCGEPSDQNAPTAFPDEVSNGKNVVFLHGFSVDEQGARCWFSEMFKRLWQSGSNAKFHGVTWEGDTRWPNWLYYHEDVVNAFRTAPDLASYVNGLLGDVTIMAHSLGNMVVSSAIEDSGMTVAKYLMFNAAVPAEAYDGACRSTATIGNPMVHSDWVSYSPRTWASNWAFLFPEDDARRGLTWSNRFAHVASRTDVYNFHSGNADAKGDEVLELAPTAPGLFTGNMATRPEQFSWHKQEIGKGRDTIRNLFFAGTSWGGWGFYQKRRWGRRPGGHGSDYVREPIPASVANAMTDSQLVQCPIFLHEPPAMMSPDLTTDDRNEILAKAIPALSGPAGSQVVDFYQNPRLDNLININMNTMGHNVWWGRSDEHYLTRWLHSDIVNMNFPAVRNLFVNFILPKGALQ